MRFIGQSKGDKKRHLYVEQLWMMRQSHEDYKKYGNCTRLCDSYSPSYRYDLPEIVEFDNTDNLCKHCQDILDNKRLIADWVLSKCRLFKGFSIDVCEVCKVRFECFTDSYGDYDEEDDD